MYVHLLIHINNFLIVFFYQPANKTRNLLHMYNEGHGILGSLLLLFQKMSM
jgi:hypothetical protein